jgi:hypothetical protein
MKRKPARQPALAREEQRKASAQANRERFRQRSLDLALRRLLRQAVKPE